MVVKMIHAFVAVALFFASTGAAMASAGPENCGFYLNSKQPIIDTLLEKHEQAGVTLIKAKKLQFFGLPTVSGYTAPIGVQGHDTEIAQLSLVENPMFRDEDPTSEPGPLQPVEGNLGFFRAQDLSSYYSPRAQVGDTGIKEPFLSVVGNEIIFGGTMYVSAIEMAPQISIYRSSVSDPTRGKFITTSPIGMRNLRLRKLPSGKIHAVIQRSGNSEFAGGLGRNAFVNLNNLSELDELKLLSAMINKFQVGPGEGISTTHIEPMAEDIAYLANLFRRDPQNPDRHQSYVAVYSKLDPTPQIVLRHQDLVGSIGLEKDEGKFGDHIVAEGIVRNFDGTATLFLTVGKSEAWKVTIPDPFLRFSL